MPDGLQSGKQKKISLRADERIFICGKTGSGKTFLARHLTGRLKRLIVLDGKGTLGSWGLLEWNRETRRALKSGEEVRTRVLLDTGARSADEFWSEVFETIYGAGNVTIYIDEMYAIVDPGARPLPILTALYTRGRELGIGMWTATQRPTWIPLVCISEAEHIFLFRLNLDEDRRRMSAFMSDAVMQPIRDPHGFYYMRAEWENPSYQTRFNPNGKGGD